MIADIDYGFVEAKTVMGRIGIKVWIYKGDILGKQFVQEETKTAGQQQQSKEQFRPQR